MTEFKDALKILKQNDPKLGKIIDFLKPEYNKKIEDEFTSLVKIIIGQQLSGSAAKIIISRVEETLKEKIFTPLKISTTPHKNLRNCGISNAKITYRKSFSEISDISGLSLRNLNKPSYEIFI